MDYGQDYLNINYKLNKAHKEFHFNMFPIRLHGMYSNVTHQPFQLEMSTARLDFTRMASDLENVVFIELPLIKFFKMAFDYEWETFLLHGKGRFDLTLNQTTAIVTLKLGTTDKGHLYPQIHDLKLNYTGATLTPEGNLFKKLFYAQIFTITKYVSMAALNRFGARVYNVMLPEYFRRLTNS